jgi:hypothetical protein
MKKYIFTESQIKKIVNSVLNEQPGTMSFDQKVAINDATKEFLDKKGIKGLDLTERIKIYQKSIRCEETGHMMDCKDMMPKEDKKIWQDYINKNKPIYDKAADWFNRMLGIGPGSGY